MPPTQRDILYRRVLSELSLDAFDRDDLLKRGFTPDEIASAGYKSVSQWQKLIGTYPTGLPGLGIGGDSLITTGDGYLIPVKDSDGLIAGCQYRLRDGSEGRYRWLSSSTKRNPNGATPHDCNGELPLSVIQPLHPSNSNTIALVEGTGAKPLLTSQRLGVPTIGAAGGLFASSPLALKKALESVGASTKRIILYPDGGAVRNSNVIRQYSALRELLKSWGYNLRIAWWKQVSKAFPDIDEMLGSLEGEALEDAIKGIEIITWEKFEKRHIARGQTIERALKVINDAIPKADIETVGGYLPALAVHPGEVLAIDANMGAGKTSRIISDVVKPAISQGKFVIWLSPRNSLGKQSAQLAGIPHVHDYGTDKDSQQALGADMRLSGGAISCSNSLPKVLAMAPTNRQIVVVFDEAMALLTETCEGGTLGKRWGKVHELLIGLMRSAESIVAVESGIDRPTIEFLKALAWKPLRLIRHKREADPWDCLIHAGGSPASFRANLIDRLLQGQNLWLTSTSVDDLRKWELWAQDHGIKSALICGETNDSGVFDDFFTDPDQWLSENRPQLLLTNQSVQTGLSVTLPYFDAVAGFAPGFSPEVIYQQLGRYRVPCDRIIWAPDYIQPNRYEKPQRETILGEIGREVTRWGGKGFKRNSDPDQVAIEQFLAARWELAWAQKINAAEVLTDKLIAAGHHVTVVKGESDPAIVELWKELKERLARSRAELMASLKPEDWQDEKWAHALKDDGESTYNQRCIARKVLESARFPGVDWDNADIWYYAYFAPVNNATGEDEASQQRPLAPGASLWAECSELGKVWALDSVRAAQLLADRLKPLHLLPDSHAKAEILAPFKPMIEALMLKGTIHPSDPMVKAMAAKARGISADLTRYTRITAKDTESDTAIVNKLLGKFAIGVDRLNRVRIGGKQMWVYSIQVSDLWRQLVAARTQSLQALRAIVGGETDSLRDYLTNLSHPIPHGLSPADWDDLRSMVRVAREGGKNAIAELKAVVITTFSPNIWEALAA